MTAILWSALALTLGIAAYAIAYRLPRRLRWLSWTLVVPAAMAMVIGQAAVVITSTRALGGSEMVEIVAVLALMVAEVVAVVIYEARR